MSKEISIKEAIKLSEDYLREAFGLKKEDVFLEEITPPRGKKDIWLITLSYFEENKDPRKDIGLFILQGATGRKPIVKRYKVVGLDEYGSLVYIKKHEVDH